MEDFNKKQYAKLEKELANAIISVQIRGESNG